MLPGFHANSNDGSYTGNNNKFVAKIGNPTTETVLPSSTVGNNSASLTENYIYTRTYLAPVTQSNKYAPQVQSITYFDGLGRPKQNIAIKSTPGGNDLVTPIVYDGFGRQTLDYLPVPVSTLNGSIQPTTVNNIDPYYWSLGVGGNAFSEKKLENSPLDRVLEQYGPGDDWRNNSKRTTFDYMVNEASEVLKFVTSTPTPWTDNITHSTLSLATGNYYAKATLYKNKVTDEDDNVSYEFKNGQGQTLLVRKMLTTTQSADTYYVYNEYDQLAFVISPKGVEEVLNNLATADLTETGAILSELSYQYRYDGRNRLAEKKLPGKGWESMVYDNQDRLVMTQDANLKDAGEWLFTKYDQFGRVAYTGITSDSGTRSSLQTTLNGKGSNNVSRTTSSGFTAPGLIVYYDNLTANNYPNTITKLLSVNYYDSYPADKPNLSTLAFQQTFITDNFQNNINTKSLPVASYLNNIENHSWTKTFNYYDEKGHIIGTYSRNHLGGYTQTESFVDFTGTPQKTITRHKRKTADTEVRIAERFIYDYQNRLKQHYHQVNSNAEVLLAENTYDELGRLVKKQVGNNLQEVNYAYNIRGWMTGINDLGNIGTDIFAYKINYNTVTIPTNLRKPYLADQSLEVNKKYNGNISQIDWLIADPALSSQQQKSYGYTYDALNRLRAGFYYVKNSGQYTFPEENNEILKYDLNGNISELKRFSYNIGTTSSLIDDLSYHYTGNRLTSIDDVSGDANGYEGGNSTIDYDDNGNMITMPDKRFNSITYNHLNLPNAMDMGSGKRKSSSSTLYRADGVKLRKSYTSLRPTMPGIWATVTATTHYLDGFQYLDPGTSGLTLAANSFEEDNELDLAMEREAFQRVEEVALTEPGTGIESATLQFVPTAEGYYSFVENRYIYQYRDHLGNARVSYARNSTDGIEVTDKNNYYPFGMNHLDNDSGSFFGQSSYKNYKYNGKELQETGMYDYGARMYMADIGRWGVIDPLAELYYSYSSYQYTANNPMKFIDPTGMWINIKDGDNTYRYNNGKYFTQNLETKEWDVEASVKSDSYAGQILSSLTSITGGDKNSFGSKFLGLFANDDVNTTIKSSKGSKFEGKNGTSTDGSVVLTAFDQEVKPYTSMFGEKSSQTSSPFYATLFHELGHSWFDQVSSRSELGASWVDADDKNNLPNNIPQSEIAASYIENLLRSEQGMPIRTSYSPDANTASTLVNVNSIKWSPTTSGNSPANLKINTNTRIFTMPNSVQNIYNKIMNSKK
ncbi:MAG: hypothetical protein BGO86_05050 [Chryseobacterium sp. 36-9]|nr:MAG: hypothetical protein BGO86_05050 [Chryseobacterium sp. 36-9]